LKRLCVRNHYKISTEQVFWLLDHPNSAPSPCYGKSGLKRFRSQLQRRARIRFSRISLLNFYKKIRLKIFQRFSFFVILRVFCQDFFVDGFIFCEYSLPQDLLHHFL
jgi:hypothetical protein